MNARTAEIERPIRVALLGFNSRTFNMLQMFFSSRGKGLAELVSERDAEAAIFDLDALDGLQLWQKFARDGSRPALVLSVTEHTLENAVWVRKPLNLDTFAHAVDQLVLACRSSATHLPVKIESTADPALVMRTAGKRPASSTDSQPAPKHSRPVAAAAAVDTAPPGALQPAPVQAFDAAINRSTRLLKPANEDDYYHRDLRSFYGDRSDNHYLDRDRQGELFYDPDKYLQGILATELANTRRTGVAVRLEGLGKPLILLADKNLLLSDMRDQYLRGLCTQPSHILRVSSSRAADLELPTGQAALMVRGECVLWKVALWTSRGRVPTGTALDRPVRLRRWPNFTRLSKAPHAVQIVAHWSRSPCSLRSTAEALQVPYRAVFGVFSACKALGLVDQDFGAMSSQRGGNPLADIPEATRRRLLGALLRKLG